MDGERLCGLCGTSIEGRRRHARFCSGACRAEASRLRRILSGSEADGFGSIAARVASMGRNRTYRPDGR